MALREYEVAKGKGRAFIINVHPIDRYNDTASTLGWAKHGRSFMDNDSAALTKQFKACGYEVEEHSAYNKEEVIDHVEKIRKMALTSSWDALVIAFSAYGDEGTLFCSGGNVEINELLMSSFKGDVCTNLAGKPKVFLLQTCNHPLYPFSGPEAADSPGDEDVYRRDGPEKNLYKIPAEANFVFVQCLIPGSTPWRDEQKDGSMFYSNFCKHIANSPLEGYDIHQIMTRTRTDIDAEMMERAKKVYEETWKKLPLMSSTLTKKLRFKKQ